MTDLNQLFNDNFGGEGNILSFRSPGRVNLIGEHTDYNDGFVFPAAVNLEISSLARKRDDKNVRIYSADFSELTEFSLDQLDKKEHWSDYIKGVAQILSQDHTLSHGMDLVMSSTVPAGSGLSSSAAVEMLSCFILCQFNSIKMSPADMALLSQKAENQYIGVACGIMDQFAVALGKTDCALFLDSRDLNYENVPLSLSDHKIVIANTNKPRKLSESAYNTRRSQCEEAVKVISGKKKINSLREADLDLLAGSEGEMDPVVFKRARHVISENNRVLEAVDLLKQGKLKEFGASMNASHISLRDDYEVSCTELDTLVEEALEVQGVLGSRMTGAGFGGCTVSLVENSAVDNLIKTAGENYEKKTGLKADFYIVDAAEGTGNS